MAGRYQVQIWDNRGWMPQTNLDLVDKVKVRQEENGAYQLDFTYPINDDKFGYLEKRKIIRLVDLDKDTIPLAVNSTVAATRRVNLTGAAAQWAQYKLGDYVIVFDETPNNFSSSTTAAEVAGQNVEVGLGSAAGLAVGEYVRIADGTVAESVEIDTVSAPSIFADLGYDHIAGAAVTQPARSFVARIQMIETNGLFLSRFDFTPSTNSVVRKINFNTFRISDIIEDKSGGIAMVRIVCQHLLFDLNDTTFFKDARVDVAWNSKGTGQIVDDKVDIGTFVDNVLARGLDASDEPISNLDFIKGNLYRHEYKTGKCSTAASAIVTGDTLSAWNGTDDDVFFSAGSVLAIRDETDLFTITRKSTNTVLVTPNTSNTDSDLEYLIVSKGFHEQTDRIGTCDVVNGSAIVDNFSFSVIGGDIEHGAILMVEGDDKEYYTDYVTDSPSVVLTEDIERANGTNINCIIKKDEREITIGTSTTLLGALNEALRVFTDDRQLVYMEVNEDRSVNIVRKPLPDGRDPTSDAVVKYHKSNVKNLRNISREIDISRFGNRVIGLGASSGWVNSFSGVQGEVQSLLTKDAYQLETDDAAKFRFGDPLQVYDSPFSFTIASATQVTATRTVPNQYNQLDDGGVFTAYGDAGTGAALDETTTFAILPAAIAVSDAWYHGADEIFNKFQMKFSTIGKGSWVGIWEYWTGAAWVIVLHNKKGISDFIVDSSGDPIGSNYSATDAYYENIFDPPTDWAKTTVNGTNAYWIRFRITTGDASPTAQPIGLRAINGGGLVVDGYAGGLIQILSGDGAGQTRRIVGNSASQIDTSRKWDELPVDSTAIISKNIGNTFVRGFGYKKLSVSAATDTTFDTDTYDPAEHAYRGGMLTISKGTGLAQSFRILDNTSLGGGSSRWTIMAPASEIFNPRLDTSSEVEVTALPQMVHEQRSSTTFVDGGTKYVEFTPTIPFSVDMWNGGNLHITSGDEEGDIIAITDTVAGSTWRIEVAAWSGVPTDGDSILLVRATDLPVSVATGLEFAPDAGDKVTLLMKESGGNLTVGKHADNRTSVVSATRTKITLQSGDGSKFAKNQLIFLGAKSFSSEVYFDLDRGSQVAGQQVAIASVSGDVLTIREDMNPVAQPGDHVEILAVVDEDSIITNGIVEVPFENDTADPKVLKIEVDKFIERIKTVVPRYKLSFIDLFQFAPEQFQFDSFKLSDTVHVIDEDLGIETDIRIVEIEFDPSRPGDLSNTLQLGRKTRSFARDRMTGVVKQLNILTGDITKLQRQYAAPVCVWWSDEHKKCVRTKPPNWYCDTKESNNDGRLQRSGAQIDKLRCQAYRGVGRRHRPETETSRVSMEKFDSNGITNTTFDDTNIVGLGVDFIVNKNSEAVIVGVHVQGFPSSSVLDAGDFADAQIWLEPATQEVIPFDDEAGTGAYIQVRRLSGSSTLDLRGVALLIGFDD